MASGINLYATALTLGLLQRFHLAHLPGDLGYLSHNWILITSAILFAVQFIADKIPAVDSAWDLVHTFVRIPAGAILASAAVAHFDPKVRMLAMLIGGGIALSSHGTKTATRLAANMSPEPFSNVLLSLLGDALTVGGSLLLSVHPAILIAVVIVGVALSLFFTRWIVKSFRRLFNRKTSKPLTA